MSWEVLKKMMMQVMLHGFPVPLTSTEFPSRSTTSLLALRKSAPSSGNRTPALRKGYVNFCSPNLTVLVTGPQQRMAEPPPPCRGGPHAGADELWGTTEYAAPVSIRNFIPESLSTAWAKLAGDAGATYSFPVHAQVALSTQE